MFASFVGEYSILNPNHDIINNTNFLYKRIYTYLLTWLLTYPNALYWVSLPNEKMELVSSVCLYMYKVWGLGGRGRPRNFSSWRKGECNDLASDHLETKVLACVIRILGNCDDLGMLYRMYVV